MLMVILWLPGRFSVNKNTLEYEGIVDPDICNNGSEVLTSGESERRVHGTTVAYFYDICVHLKLLQNKMFK